MNDEQKNTELAKAEIVFDDLEKMAQRVDENVAEVIAQKASAGHTTVNNNVNFGNKNKLKRNPINVGGNMVNNEKKTRVTQVNTQVNVEKKKCFLARLFKCSK
ncbi:MAG: hypothetical protein FWD49_04575 [Firmicutes bacterium]|nr:hypothetical protein [Bacillota bacterium]